MNALKWSLPICLSLVVLAFQLFGDTAPTTSAGDSGTDAQLDHLRARIVHLSDNLTQLRRELAGKPQDCAPPTPAPVSVSDAESSQAGATAQTANEPPPASQAAESVEPVEAEPSEADWQPPKRGSDLFDINRDGSVTSDEVARGDDLAVRASEFAHNRSSDGSYPIIAEDFRGDPKFFGAMDVNHDGALSEREAVAYFIESIRELRRYDQDFNGALAVAEFGHLESRFGFLDTNGDAKIEAWEINILRGRGKW